MWCPTHLFSCYSHLDCSSRLSLSILAPVPTPGNFSFSSMSSRSSPWNAPWIAQQLRWTAQEHTSCYGLHRNMAVRSYLSPKVRGSDREELPHPGGQRPRLRGAIPPPRSSCCPGAGGLRGANPHSRSGGAAVRRHPLSKVRSSG